MDELRALLATGHLIAMRQKGEVIEIVTAHSESGADEQPLRLTVITGLDPDLDYEVQPCHAATLEEAVRGAAALAEVPY